MITNGYSAYYAYLNRTGVVCPAGYHVENQALARLPKKFRGTADFPLSSGLSRERPFPCRKPFRQHHSRLAVAAGHSPLLRSAACPPCFFRVPCFLGLGEEWYSGRVPLSWGWGVFVVRAFFFSPGVACPAFPLVDFLWNPWCLRSFWRCPVGYGRVKFPAVILWRGSICVSLGCGGCFTRAFPGMGMPPVSLGGWVFRRGPRRRLQLLG